MPRASVTKASGITIKSTGRVSYTGPMAVITLEPSKMMRKMVKASTGGRTAESTSAASKIIKCTALASWPTRIAK